MKFPLRVNDDGLWSRFRRFCDEHDVSINTALLLLIRAAVDGKVSIGARRA
jgi:hypothetical protein